MCHKDDYFRIQGILSFLVVMMIMMIMMNMVMMMITMMIIHMEVNSGNWIKKLQLNL